MLQAKDNETTNSSIDVVITWVDGSDPAWQAIKHEYERAEKGTSIRSADTRDARFRPWDTLRFLFRGIEKNAPWVRKIHFVTWGHLPNWLNTAHEKLNIVRHEDYIPKQYLPTFSSRTIELNLHRIKGLSSQFVNFNDDTLILRKTNPSTFFVNGLPCDSAVMTPYRVYYGDWFFAHITDVAILNKHFSLRESLRNNPLKWINAKYGIDVFRTISLLPYSSIFGIRNYHLPGSLLKSTYDEVWQSEPEILDATCSHRFRVSTDPNQWLIQYWQLAKGQFHPRSTKTGRSFQISTTKDAEKAATYIKKKGGSLICVNDIVKDADEYNRCRFIVEEALLELYPKPSSFEIDQ